MKSISRRKTSVVTRRKRILLFVPIIIIILLLIALNKYFISPLFTSPQVKQADLNEKYLNDITIIEGKKLNSTARPDGDFLTASDALAKAEIDVNDTLDNLYRITMANLKAQGFTGDGYTNTSSSNHDVYFKTTNGSKSIVLEYKFENPIDCGNVNNFQMFCENQGYKTVETSGLKDVRINKILVVYDND
jgi:hypothetical protein